MNLKRHIVAKKNQSVTLKMSEIKKKNTGIVLYSGFTKKHNFVMIINNFVRKSTWNGVKITVHLRLDELVQSF